MSIVQSRRVVATAVAGAAALLVAACSGEGPAVTAVDSRTAVEAQPTALSALTWGDCDDPVVVSDEYECATLTVPLDYTRPDGDTIDLALIRLPATRSRDGAVLTNPGGPGASGFDFIAAVGTTLRAEMGLDEFDIIGFDPRGVDRSGGLRCLTDAEVDASLYLDYTPDTPAEQELLDNAPAEFEDACTDAYGDTLSQYSTQNTARDMDAIRNALGDQQISYLGISYGTYLGGVYASMFPSRVRAMVLDAAFDPVGDTVEESYSTQLVGFEEAFDNWATWCADTPAECAFSTDDVGAAWDRLSDRLDAEPVENSDGRMANQAVLDTATKAALYSETAWPVLGSALATADGGDPAGLFALADGYTGRSPDGTYSTEQQSFGIISCASGFSSPTPDDPEALAEELRQKAPRFGGEITADDLAADDGCSTLTPDAQLQEIGYSGEAPILVVGGENDPATPIRWAKEMTEAMGPSARLLTYTGEGHGFVLVSRCVTEAEAQVLVWLDLPDDGASCDPDPDVVRPDWWDSLPVPPGMSTLSPRPDIFSSLGLGPTVVFGEAATTSLGADQALDAYDTALVDAGFELLGRQQPIDGVDQAFYATADAQLSILVIGSEDLQSPDLSTLTGLVDPDETLVLLLYIPL